MARLLLLIFIVFGSNNLLFSQKMDYFSRQKFDQEGFELEKIKEIKISNRKKYSAYYDKNQKLFANRPLVEEIKFQKGLPSEKIYYNSYGEIKKRFVFRYDKKKNLTEEEIFNEYDQIISRRNISYTKGNDTSEVVIIRSKKNSNERRVFEYNSNNQLISVKWFDNNENNYLTQNFIYENGILSSLFFLDKENRKVNESQFVYNSAGNLAIEKINGVEKKYTYDDKDCLTKVESGNEIRVYKYNDRNYIQDDQFFINSNRRQFRATFTYLQNGLLDEVIRYDSEDIKVFYSKYTYQ